MNRYLLADLQRHSSYPSVTVLLSTESGPTLSSHDAARLDRLVDHAVERLTAEVKDRDVEPLADSLRVLALEQMSAPAAAGLALCVSDERTVAVRLGSPVRERVVVDSTFATRDLVADLARTAAFRVIAVSEQRSRMFLGDRNSLVEVHDDSWPLLRTDEDSPSLWARAVFDAAVAATADLPLPTVVAGVERTLRRVGVEGAVPCVGMLNGNHDRTAAHDLHPPAWALVDRHLEQEQARALERLERARSRRRFAGGIDEVWSLAVDGRVDLLLVEESFEQSALLGPGETLLPAAGPGGPDVVDDIVDEAIEAVLLRGGRTVVVPDRELDDHGRIAAVLRY